MGDLQLQVDQLEEFIESREIMEEDAQLTINDVLVREEANAKHASLSLNIKRKWGQRAKERWAKDAEQNFRYLHQMASYKYCYRNINCLNIEGELYYDKVKIAKEATEFYSNLFTEDHFIRMDFEDIELPTIYVSESISLERPFSEEKVKHVIWNFGFNKALRPEDLTMEFFKVVWEVIRLLKNLNPGVLLIGESIAPTLSCFQNALAMYLFTILD